MTEAKPSSEARTEAMLTHAGAADPAIFTRLYATTALREAQAADARAARGARLSPLDGLIVTIKDLFDIAGEPTTAGAALRRNAPAAIADAPVVARLRAAGAVILGKTNMTEFAFSGLGLNPHFGTPGNARDAARIPGGSSSGAGVAVARGLCDIAIGSDTGGSVRIPAALNGVAGFKPTARRIPRAGAYPLSYTLDSIGPLAASVALCAAADAVMAGEAPPPGPAPVAGQRIAIAEPFLDETEPSVSAAFADSIGRLRAAGCQIVPLPIGDLVAAMRASLAAAPIVVSEAAAIHREAMAEAPEAFDPRVLARIAPGRDVRALDYIAGLRRREALIVALDARLAEADAWLAMPTVPLEAPLIADLRAEAAFHATNMRVLRNPSFGNFFDLCAISLPMPKEGLPAGLMLLGRTGADAALLAFAEGCERAL